MLVTLDEWKEFAGISSSENDDFIEDQLSLLSDVVEAYCRRRFEVANYTQTFYRDDYCPSSKIQLFQYPSVSVTSITEDGSLVDPSLYRLNNQSGNIIGVDGKIFYCAKETIVVYSAGFDPIPSPVSGVIKSIMQERYNKKVAGIDLNFGSEVQRISIPGTISIDFDYSLNNNERKNSFGTILGSHLNVLDFYRSERAIIGDSRLIYLG